MKKVSGYIAILLITAFFMSCISVTGKKFSGVKTFSLAQLQEDFKQITAIISDEHPKLYADKDGLENLLNKQYQKLRANMNELEFFRILAPVVSSLNCGHTILQLSPEFESLSGKYLPLQVKIIENKVYVRQDFSDARIPAGTEILAINEEPVQVIINRMLQNITSDGSNLTKKYNDLSYGFGKFYFNYIDAPGQFHLSIQNPGTTSPAKLTLPAVSHAKLQNQFMIESVNSDYLYKFPCTKLITENYGYLMIKSFAFYQPEQQKYAKLFIDEFFQMLTASKKTDLILDLRDNLGGDPYCSAYLFQYLIQKPTVYFATDTPYYDELKIPLEPAANNFQGHLYILINGASFSSTGHFCSLLKYHKMGTFIGEETGGSYVCTDNPKDTTLKNTKLRFHYSTMAFKTAVSGLTPGRGIMPDYPVRPTIDDFMAGKDVEKEFAIGLIEKRKTEKWEKNKSLDQDID